MLPAELTQTLPRLPRLEALVVAAPKPMMPNSEKRLAASMELLRKIYPKASDAELLEIRSTLDRYFDVGLRVFTRLHKELFPETAFDENPPSAYDEGTKVEP